MLTFTANLLLAILAFVGPPILIMYIAGMKPPRLDDYWSNETPWDCNLTDFLGKIIIVVQIEQATTQYGPGYLVHLAEVGPDGEPMEPHIAVTSNSVIVKQFDALLAASNQGEPVFPLPLTLVKEKGKNNRYYMLQDIDPPPEE